MAFRFRRKPKAGAGYKGEYHLRGSGFPRKVEDKLRETHGEGMLRILGSEDLREHSGTLYSLKGEAHPPGPVHEEDSWVIAKRNMLWAMRENKPKQVSEFARLCIEKLKKNPLKIEGGAQEKWLEALRRARDDPYSLINAWEAVRKNWLETGAVITHDTPFP